MINVEKDTRFGHDILTDVNLKYVKAHENDYLQFHSLETLIDHLNIDGLKRSNHQNQNFRPQSFFFFIFYYLQNIFLYIAVYILKMITCTKIFEEKK
jgi:hypothetical protein